MKHLFVTVMNNSGSTVLNDYLSRCRLAIGMREEGQRAIDFQQPIRCTPRLWTEQESSIADPQSYDWPTVAKRWHEIWMAVKPDVYKSQDRVLVEKSPLNVIRAPLLQDAFPGSHFLIMVRNPYAVVEGIRRVTRIFHASIERAVRHWVRCSQLQRLNRQRVDRTIFLRYEDVAAQPRNAARSVSQLMPELHDLDFEVPIASRCLQGAVHCPFMDFNERQISRLTDEEIRRITDILRPHDMLMNEFGYDLIE